MLMSSMPVKLQNIKIQIYMYSLTGNDKFDKNNVLKWMMMWYYDEGKQTLVYVCLEQFKYEDINISFRQILWG